MISTAVYYFLSDELHSYTFQPPGGHLQTIKVHKITTATCIYINIVYFVYNVYVLVSIRKQQCKWCIELWRETTTAMDGLWCNSYIFQHTEVSSWHDVTETSLHCCQYIKTVSWLFSDIKVHNWCISNPTFQSFTHFLLQLPLFSWGYSDISYLILVPQQGYKQGNRMHKSRLLLSPYPVKLSYIRLKWQPCEQQSHLLVSLRTI